MTMYFILDNLRSRLRRHKTFALHQCQWWWLHTPLWQESYFIVTLTFRVLLMRHCSGSEDASLFEISTCVSICCHFFRGCHSSQMESKCRSPSGLICALLSSFSSNFVVVLANLLYNFDIQGWCQSLILQTQGDF